MAQKKWSTTNYKAGKLSTLRGKWFTSQSMAPEFPNTYKTWFSEKERKPKVSIFSGKKKATPRITSKNTFEFFFLKKREKSYSDRKSQGILKLQDHIL